MKRIVQPELLDTLAPDDPRAVCSRRDLQRVNGLMRHHVIMADTLQKNLNVSAPRKIVELGAGDGDFLLGVARKLSPSWPGTHATLLDLQKNVAAETITAFAKIGWQAKAVVADVFNWPQTSDTDEVVVANLFLHHFENALLAELLRLISRRAEVFIALEPRRARWPLFCSRLLGAVGCNDVTRHDAVVSVRAGFSGYELSSLWTDNDNWRLTEQSAGAFSHLFIARKIS